MTEMLQGHIGDWPVELVGGDIGLAQLVCGKPNCCHILLSNGGGWPGPDNPKMTLAELVANVTGHANSCPTDLRRGGHDDGPA